MLCLNNGKVVSVIKSRVGEGRWKEMTFGKYSGSYVVWGFRGF